MKRKDLKRLSRMLGKAMARCMEGVSFNITLSKDTTENTWTRFPPEQFDTDSRKRISEFKDGPNKYWTPIPKVESDANGYAVAGDSEPETQSENPHLMPNDLRAIDMLRQKLISREVSRKELLQLLGLDTGDEVGHVTLDTFDSFASRQIRMAGESVRSIGKVLSERVAPNEGSSLTLTWKKEGIYGTGDWYLDYFHNSDGKQERTHTEESVDATDKSLAKYKWARWIRNMLGGDCQEFIIDGEMIDEVARALAPSLNKLDEQVLEYKFKLRYAKDSGYSLHLISPYKRSHTDALIAAQTETQTQAQPQDGGKPAIEVLHPAQSRKDTHGRYVVRYGKLEIKTDDYLGDTQLLKEAAYRALRKHDAPFEWRPKLFHDDILLVPIAGADKMLNMDLAQNIAEVVEAVMEAQAKK